MGEAGARSPGCQNHSHSEEPSLPRGLGGPGDASTQQLPPNLPKAAETQTPKGQRAGKQPGDTQNRSRGHLLSEPSSVSYPAYKLLRRCKRLALQWVGKPGLNLSALVN